MTPAIVAFIGPSGAGKTSLLVRLIGTLTARGYRVGAIKHTHHHAFEIDREGKDSERLKRAGAEAVALTCESQLALIRDVDREPDPQEVVRLYLADVDWVLVEGSRRISAPKVLVWYGYRHGNEGPREDLDEWLNTEPVALVVRGSFKESGESPDRLPTFRADQVEALADFLEGLVR